jgi:hypothetical protein
MNLANRLPQYTNRKPGCYSRAKALAQYRGHARNSQINTSEESPPCN